MVYVTFVLDGVALVRRGSFGDGPTNKHDELPDGDPLEIPKMTHVCRVR